MCVPVVLGALVVWIQKKKKRMRDGRKGGIRRSCHGRGYGRVKAQRWASGCHIICASFNIYEWRKRFVSRNFLQEKTSLSVNWFVLKQNFVLTFYIHLQSFLFLQLNFLRSVTYGFDWPDWTTGRWCTPNMSEVHPCSGVCHCPLRECLQAGRFWASRARGKRRGFSPRAEVFLKTKVYKKSFFFTKPDTESQSAGCFRIFPCRFFFTAHHLCAFLM